MEPAIPSSALERALWWMASEWWDHVGEGKIITRQGPVRDPGSIIFSKDIPSGPTA